ncbi:hypothetical protein HDU76_010884, partial [Blyttiomyces sp. JEL0837]
MDPHYYKMLDIVIPNDLPPHVMVFSKGSVEAQLNAKGKSLLDSNHVIEFIGTPEEFSTLFTSVDNNKHRYPPPTTAHNRLIQQTPEVITSEVASVHEEGHDQQEQSEEITVVQQVGQEGIEVVQEQQDEEMVQQEDPASGQEEQHEHMMNLDEQQLQLPASQSSSHSTQQLQLVPFQPLSDTSTEMVLHSQEQYQSRTPLQQSIGSTSGVSKRKRSESSVQQESSHMDILEARNKSLNEQFLDDINNNPSTLRALKDSGKTIP